MDQGEGEDDGDGLAGGMTSEPKFAPPLHPGRRWVNPRRARRLAGLPGSGSIWMYGLVGG